MAEQNHVAAILEEMEKRRGYVYPAHRYLAERCPQFLVAYNELVGAALLHDATDAEPPSLPVKYRELVVACVLSALRASEGSLVVHLKRAMEAGLTNEEALEAFQATVVPGGAPTLLNGVRALMELERRTEAREPDGRRE